MPGSAFFEGDSFTFLRLGLEGPILVETFLDGHRDVISGLPRVFFNFEGDSFSSAEGHLPSFERTLNLLSRGKAFLDRELPKNQTLFVTNVNASRVSCFSCPVVFSSACSYSSDDCVQSSF